MLPHATTNSLVAGSKSGVRGWKACLACNIDGATDLTTIQHPMESCDVWGLLSLKEKESRVNCIKHPFKTDHTTQTCTVSGKRCKFCSLDTHHFLLCPSKSAIKSSANAVTMSVSGNGELLPVMVQAQYVVSPDGSKVGTLMDLCSTDDYVTHRYARKNNLCGHDVELIVEGMGGNESFVSTKLYKVPIMVESKCVELLCYGMDKISSVAAPPSLRSYEALCKEFDVHPDEVERPITMDLFISVRRNHLHPTCVKTVGGIFSSST